MPTAVTPIAGRKEELATFDAMLERTAGGESSFATLSGDPGVGKTTMLRELARRAGEQGFLVLDGRAAEFEREVPFAVWVDALDEYLVSLDRRATERVAGDGLDALARMFPALEGLGGESAQPADRAAPHRAVRDLLERVALSQPVLVLLDDMHWADDASRELAWYLAYRHPQARVMIVAAIEAGHEPPRWRGTTELFLTPLTFDEPRELAAGAIHADLARLRPAARALCDAAAVLGDPFDVDLAFEVADLGVPATTTALDEVVETGLIEPTDIPRRFRFRHPLVRSAVYDEIAPGSQMDAHRRAAAALAGRGAPPIERAHHVEASAMPGDTEAIASLREAAASVVVPTPAAAAHLLEAALHLAPTSTTNPDRAGLLIELGTALAAAGQPAAATLRLSDAIELLDDDDPRGVPLSIRCSTIEQTTGRRADAHQRAVALLEMTPAGSAARARVQTHLGFSTRYAADFVGLDYWAREAVATADRQEDDAVRQMAIGLLSYSHCHQGDIPAAQAARAHARTLFDVLGRSGPGADAEGIFFLASASYFLGRYEDALAESRHGAAVATDGCVAALQQIEAAALLGRGDVADAAALHDRLIDGARLAGDSYGLMWALSRRSREAHLAADPHLALAAAEEALAIGDELDRVDSIRGPLVSVISHAAPALLHAGHAGRVRDLMLLHAGGRDLPVVGAFDCARHYAILAEAAGQLDDQDAREDFVERAEAAATKVGLPVADAHATHARAKLELDHGDPAAAQRSARAGIAAAETAGARIDAAEIKVTAGQALAAAGDTAAAVAEFDAVAGTATEYGAEAVGQAAAAQLRRLGRGRFSRVTDQSLRQTR